MAEDIISTVKNLLGDNAEDKIKAVLEGLGSSSENDIIPVSESVPSPVSDFNPDKLKSLIGQLSNAGDSRSNLLMSLKPFMRSERQKSIDSAIKLLNLTKLTGFLK